MAAARALSENQALLLATKLRRAAAKKALKALVPFGGDVPAPPADVRRRHVAVLDYFGWHFEMSCVAFSCGIEQWQMAAARTRAGALSVDHLSALALFAGETTMDEDFVLGQLEAQVEKVRATGALSAFAWFWFEGEVPAGLPERVLAEMRARPGWTIEGAELEPQNMPTPKGPPA